MNIPLRYEKASFSSVSPEIKKAFDKIRKDRRGIYLHGSVGTGKTHTLYALAKQLKEENFKVMVHNSTEFIYNIKREFDLQPIDREHILERTLEFKGVLFIDDIGAEKMTDWVLETFYLIINKRYEERLPTVFTSNCTIAELAERIGDRSASRIVESCEIVELSGQDRRLKKSR